MFLFILKVISIILFLLLSIINFGNGRFLSAGCNIACAIIWGVMAYWEWKEMR